MYTFWYRIEDDTPFMWHKISVKYQTAKEAIAAAVELKKIALTYGIHIRTTLVDAE